jgi:hypothetical protein
MAQRHDFMRAFRAAGSPPCDKYGCSSRAVCAAQLKACSAFVYFVRTGEARPPTVILADMGTTEPEGVGPTEHTVIPLPSTHHFALLNRGI